MLRRSLSPVTTAGASTDAVAIARSRLSNFARPPSPEGRSAAAEVDQYLVGYTNLKRSV